MIRTLKSIAAAAVLGLAILPTVALAHHSFAMFDFTKTTTLKGTVKDFQWTNPHVTLWVVGAPSAGGASDLWTAELTSPGNLTRLGWSKRSLKAGDRVVLDINPLRDGRHGGAFRKVTNTDTGQVLMSNLRDQERPGL